MNYLSHQCASSNISLYNINHRYTPITYEKLLYSSMNIEGGFNITTGIFTAGYSGTWRITASAYMSLAHIFIYHNDHQISESKFTTDENAYDKAIGSRQLLMHLDTGDTVYLRKYSNRAVSYGKPLGRIEDILFCLEIVQFDV